MTSQNDLHNRLGQSAAAAVRGLILLCLTLTIGALIATSASAASAAVKEYSIDPDGVEAVVIRAAVGTVQLREGQGDAITVRLDIEGSRTGLLRRRADVSEMELDIDRRGSRLQLSFEEADAKADWIVELPRMGAVDVQLGVGEIRGELAGGDLDVRLGVGEVDLQLSKSAIGRIAATSGVGSARISGGDDSVESRKIVTESARSRGAGEHRVDIKVGVGEVNVQLR